MEHDASHYIFFGRSKKHRQVLFDMATFLAKYLAHKGLGSINPCLSTRDVGKNTTRGILEWLNIENKKGKLKDDSSSEKVLKKLFSYIETRLGLYGEEDLKIMRSGQTDIEYLLEKFNLIILNEMGNHLLIEFIRTSIAFLVREEYKSLG